MKKVLLNKSAKIIVTTLTFITLIGCKGKDGIPGPAGAKGQDGKDGVDLKEASVYIFGGQFNQTTSTIKYTGIKNKVSPQDAVFVYLYTGELEGASYYTQLPVTLPNSITPIVVYTDTGSDGTIYVNVKRADNSNLTPFSSEVFMTFKAIIVKGKIGMRNVNKPS